MTVLWIVPVLLLTGCTTRQAAVPECARTRTVSGSYVPLNEGRAAPVTDRIFLLNRKETSRRATGLRSIRGWNS